MSLESQFQEALRYQRQGDATRAIHAYRRLLAQNPRLAAVWCNLGGLYHQEGRQDEAIMACRKAVALDPGSPEAHTNLANALGGEEALVHYEEALRLGPGFYDAWVGLAGCLIRMGRHEAALEACHRAITLEPERTEGHTNLGHILLRGGRYAQAEAAWRQALELDPRAAMARLNLGVLHLMQGRWEEGWEGFEARVAHPKVSRFLRPLPQPRWEGGSFEGKTLLLWGEQGYGDTLQFLRFAPSVKAMGGKVMVACQRPLVEVAATCTGLDGVFPEEELEELEELPSFDLQAPLLSLPRILGLKPEDPLWNGPYLDIPSGEHPRWSRLEALMPEGAPRVGLVWAGRCTHDDDASRSLDPALLEPLKALEGIRWYSLQKEREARLPEALVAVELGGLLEDFSDTAYALGRLELLISVDTSVAHLAGAMGIPTLLLLPFVPDWRWMLDRDDTPWYPSFQLYRQPRMGDWGAVIERLVEDLG